MDDLTSAIPALESLFSRARSLRSPFSIAEHGRPIDFNAEKTMVASQLNSRLRGVSSEWVRRGQGQLAVQQLLRVCASEIAMAVEAASEPSMHELSSLTMQLSSMQTNVATQLFSLLSNCAQVAAAERPARPPAQAHCPQGRGRSAAPGRRTRPVVLSLSCLLTKRFQTA
jgi:hypothetical protein